MKYLLSAALITSLITVACNAEPPVLTPASKVVSADNAASTADIKQVDTAAIESAFGNFSKALTAKDTSLFIATTDAKSIYIVRKFTSGNLGGRGSELSAAYPPSSIAKDLSFAVKKQTPVELPAIFLNLPMKPFGSLPKYPLPAEIDATHFDQWAPLLLKSLTNKPEAGPGDPVILHSPSSKYWIYAEAQIINGILAGGFAVFSTENNKPVLVAVIELL
ncbi:MAG: hypothetical protein RL497_2868 [Pseudomonadota bacterium]|jgi:hypothetical protein